MGREKREEGGNEATVARMEECSSYYLPTGMLIPTSASAFPISTPFYPIYGVDLPQKVLVADLASFKMLLK